MRRSVFLLVCFFVVFVGAALTSTPMSFLLERSGLKRAGMNWTHATGDIFSGRIKGVSLGRQPIGTVSLSLIPSSLLKGRIGYRFDWTGAPGAGQGALQFGFDHVSLENGNMAVKLAQLVGLSADVRRAGGTATLSNAKITFAKDACIKAEGIVSSDALERLAAIYNQDASLFTGQLNCNGPMLQLLMNGALGSGEQITTRVEVGTQRPSSFEAHVYSQNIALYPVLSEYGFEQEADAFIYRRSMTLGRSAQ